jgi:hypothetical protein
LALAFSAIALPATAAAQQAGQPVAEKPVAGKENMRLAQQLVGVINPYDLMLQANLQSWEATVAHVLKTSPPVQKLEAQYPGISAAGIAAARPLARTYCEKFVRDAVETKARLFAEGLTKSEMTDAIGFYGSPSGRRLVAGFAANTDFQEMARRFTAEARENGRVRVTEEMATALQNKTILKTAEDISASDQIELMRFSQKPVAGKIAALAAEADRLLFAELNKPDPEWQAKQSAALNDAMLAFVDARKKR